MKSRLLCALIAAVLCPLLSATTTVTGSIKTLGGTSANNSFVRFWLRGCNGNQPRVNGVAIVPSNTNGQFYFDFPSSSTGTITGLLYSTRDAAGTGAGEIDCGGSHTAVWYGMQVFRNSVGGPETPVHAKNTGTLDVSNVTPTSTNPVVVAPTGDATYARLDAGNQPFTGSVTPSGTGTLNMGSNSNRWNGFLNTLSATGASTFNTTDTTGAATHEGTVAVTNAGVFTNTQVNQYVKSLIGGIATDMYRQQGFPGYYTEAGTFGLSVPSDAATFEDDALVAMIEDHCNSSTGAKCNAVGASVHARAMATGAYLWGRNVTIGDIVGIGPVSYRGDEIDVGIVSDQSAGYVHGLDIVLTATAPAVVPNAGNNSAGLAIFKAGGTLGWLNGIYMGAGGVTGNALWIDKGCTTGACNSPAITMTGTNGTTDKSTQLRADQSGDLVINALGGTAGVTLPSYTFAVLNAAALPSGTMAFCSDCKNVPDNGVVGGAACVAAGQGARAIRENNRWDCN